MEDVQDLIRDMQEDSCFDSFIDYANGQQESRREPRSMDYGSRVGYLDAARCLEPSVYGHQGQPPPPFGGTGNFDHREGPHEIYRHTLPTESCTDRQALALNGRTRLSLPSRSLALQPVDLPYSLGYSHRDDQSSPFELHAAPSHSSPLSQGLNRRPLPPNYPDTSSSPSFPIPSSPSYEVSQRRATKGSNRISSHFSQRQSLSYHPTVNSQETVLELSRAVINHSTPVVQGIQLVSLNELPDRFRSVFPFPLFNPVQSKCYETIYKSDDNLVLSSPTGSGKTAVLEMAICRLVSAYQADQFKIVYMAPTKSLCSERHSDWQPKFAALHLQCAELTGDSDQTQLRNVQHANLIITTPEKWDSMTRKWKDHSKLIQLVKLFLIDEVHILKDARGATLEAVVSRVKTVGSDVRFVALSATVPNSEDIAKWLGKNNAHQHLPAHEEKFGEAFRPVKLQKYVCGLSSKANDFVFDSLCDVKLPDIIAKHSCKKPIMVFCCTRKSTLTTAKLLAKLWTSKSPRERYWTAPSKTLMALDTDLKSTMTSGVAFHHAGLDSADRNTVQKAFLDGQISVICCTSTLAVGVNLPCHLVIIKNTVSWQEEGLKEYADLEIMQMIGRAGRPQFDDSAIAVIITRQEKAEKYEKLVAGEELLESCLHLNLIDHLNAEIGLGTVHNLDSAKRWLAGTFLYVRLAQNPNHYKLERDSTERNLDSRIEQICERDIRLLQEKNLVCSGGRLRSTEFGDAMARYYVKFETMRSLLGLQPKARMSEILSAISEAEEFREVRFRSAEKSLYKTLNSAPGMKFPIKIDIASATQKRSIIIQAELGGVDYPTDEQFIKHKRQYQQDRGILFLHIHRLIRCIIDCQLHLQDATTTRHALELARSFEARVWDNSPLQMKQIPSIGIVSVRKLANADINSLEALEATATHRIDLLLSKNPGYGEKVLASLRKFPKLRVTIKMMGQVDMIVVMQSMAGLTLIKRQEGKQGQRPKIRVRAEIGFLNDKPPIEFNRKPVYVCFLAERSDGFLIDFRRFSAKRLENGQDVLLSVELLNESQYINCYVMCDDIAGTMRYAELKPNLPSSLFPLEVRNQATDIKQQVARPHINIPKALFSTAHRIVFPSDDVGDQNQFSDDDIDDGDMIEAARNLDFNPVEAFESCGEQEVLRPVLKKNSRRSDAKPNDHEDWEPKRLSNGKWACNHKCKDKALCKHMCCRDGAEKPPKPPKSTLPSTKSTKAGSAELKPNFTRISARAKPKPIVNKAGRQADQSAVEVINLSGSQREEEYGKFGSRGYGKLHKLHESVVGSIPARIIQPNKASVSLTKSRQPQISFFSSSSKTGDSSQNISSDSNLDFVEDLPSPSTLVQTRSAVSDISNVTTSVFDEDISDLEAGMIDLDNAMKEQGWPEASAINYSLPSGGGPTDLSQINDDSQEGLGGLVHDENNITLPSPFRVEDLDNPYMTSKDNGLFLNTSSPEKQYNRNHDIFDKAETRTGSKKHIMDPSWEDKTFATKRKLSIPEPCQPSINTANRNLPIPKAQPFRNMEGIDLDYLLSEYGDIVEFVD